MRSFISSSDRKFIGVLALWVVALSVAANLLAGYGLHHWSVLTRRVQMGKFDVAASFENYFRNSSHCPIVILGSSIAGGLPPPGWERPDVCTITLVGQGSFLGLEVLAKSPAAPKVLFVESSFGFRDAPADQIAMFTDPLRRTLHDWLPLTTAQGNWINILWRAQYPIEQQLYRPSEPWDEWREMRKAYADIHVATYGNPVSDWSRDHMDGILKRTAELVSQMEQNGTKVIFFEAPLDPRIAALPIIHLWAQMTHSAFADHEWVTDAPEKYYLNDGVHFTGGSGSDFFNLMMTHVSITPTLPNLRFSIDEHRHSQFTSDPELFKARDIAENDGSRVSDMTAPQPDP
jgi:hypothetical protein